ncbi:Hypothetical predicted protein [Mytilus galloprovincialis]|uniref:Uncharacterized protein n=1 Tax=Mytilus galloprovincialis TaxID=29158 RepID=A0A8B6EYE2_MYTGA|nr:Hypothetical predicted protein [Mytilus galloprovincialis]
MSESQCANVCLQNIDNCCEITYATSTRECKLGQSGCCHTIFDDVSGSNVLHSSRKYGDFIKILFVSNGEVLGDWSDEEFCTKGHYAIGFKMKNESRDNTGANHVKFKCRNFKDSMNNFDLSYPPGYGTHGSYGEWSEDCPVNSAICGIKTKIHSYQGEEGDDTALNDVKFFCCE